ncbi:hypothetical protein TanjilG_23878 [Lupinus angustifolius]|uniref:Uncharacterized protein n=1 Tax=Lupinus angustifolius TaxID=3871 RepID=A0A1J7HTI9_LUPAN|nr:PREDICTED: uncharacterized protein LOC109350842 [Lupinus angustifolius]OIW09738.1 hypothetical protein TanjilG_23878 [Lupinus angustifolius]
MAYMISETQPGFSVNKMQNIEHLEGKDIETVDAISSQLHLKPSLSSSSKESKPQPLDKQVVLRRIRQRKSYNKVKSVLEALVGSSEAHNSASSQESKWLQLGDNFSSP